MLVGELPQPPSDFEVKVTLELLENHGGYPVKPQPSSTPGASPSTVEGGGSCKAVLEMSIGNVLPH